MILTFFLNFYCTFRMACEHWSWSKLWRNVKRSSSIHTASVLSISLPKPKNRSNGEGEHYQKQSLINICSTLNRHCRCHLSKKPGIWWDIVSLKPQIDHSQVIYVNKKMSSGHKPIEEGHLKQIYDDYFTPHWSNDPVCLQHKIYFDVSFFLRKRGLKVSEN